MEGSNGIHVFLPSFLLIITFFTPLHRLTPHSIILYTTYTPSDCTLQRSMTSTWCRSNRQRSSPRPLKICYCRYLLHSSYPYQWDSISSSSLILSYLILSYAISGRLADSFSLSEDIASVIEWMTVPYKFNRGILHDGNLPHLASPITSIHSSSVHPLISQLRTSETPQMSLGSSIAAAAVAPIGVVTAWHQRH